MSLWEDLQRLYLALCKHPAFVLGHKKRRDFDGLYQAVRRPDNYEGFLSGATAMTMFFQDGHTNIELPYTRNDLCLPIPCHWDDERLCLTAPFSRFPAGTEITSVEGVPLPSVIRLMSAVIPHENRYLVKSRMLHYPYANYHLFSAYNLQRMFGKKPAYEVSFDGNAELCKPHQYSGYPAFQDDSDFVSYHLDGDTAYLTLDSCICNNKYLQALDELANDCQTNGIRTLVLDLSNNMGGNAAVIDSFISHVNIDTFRRYEMIDCSTGVPEIVTERRELITNTKNRPYFPGNIICKVSHNTFSSARTFAVTLKDNGIATIAGTPTGGKPSSYGMPKRDVLPNTGIRFRVSQCLFLRPCAEQDNEDTLYPDQ